MIEIINFEDHRLLRNHAATQGLSYREYRWVLNKHEIPLEKAIEDARNGISINEHLKARKRRIIFRHRFVATAIGLVGIIGSFGLYNYTIREINKPQERLERYHDNAEMINEYYNQMGKYNNDAIMKMLRDFNEKFGFQ